MASDGPCRPVGEATALSSAMAMEFYFLMVGLSGWLRVRFSASVARSFVTRAFVEVDS